MSFGNMMYNLSKVVEQKPSFPPLDDLKGILLCAYGSKLESKLDNCSDVSSVFLVIRDECSLTNISLLEYVFSEKFYVRKARDYIRQYKVTLEHLCHLLSYSCDLKERLSSIPHLQCEIVTFILNWKPEEHVLKDIEEILAKITDSKLIKIEYIEPSSSFMYI